MKKLIIIILIGLGIAGTAKAVRFDWVFGQPTQVWVGSVSTTSDSVWWVYGQPTTVASTTLASGEGTVTAPARNRLIIIN